MWEVKTGEWRLASEFNSLGTVHLKKW
jgi:hypothetical protein